MQRRILAQWIWIGLYLGTFYINGDQWTGFIKKIWLCIASLTSNDKCQSSILRLIHIPMAGRAILAGYHRYAWWLLGSVGLFYAWFIRLSFLIRIKRTRWSYVFFRIYIFIHISKEFIILRINVTFPCSGYRYFSTLKMQEGNQACQQCDVCGILLAVAYSVTNEKGNLI